MNRSENGIIYGIVGVIGSGKSTCAEFLMIDCASLEKPCIMGDFSEGIRETLMQQFVGKDIPIDVNSQEYADWKKQEQRIYVPARQRKSAYAEVSGRQLLQRTGEYLKTLAGPDVWARWAANYVTKKWAAMNHEDAQYCDIIFGSLRFDYEAEAVFQVGKVTGKQVKIIFCNYKSSSYEISDHVSESFARYFVDKGCKDKEDITELVKEKINYDI